MTNHRRRLGFLTLGAVLIGALGAGIGWAAIPGDDGVINGCYEKRTGILRVVDAESGKQCLSIETPISWNQKGQPGVQGPAGAQGPAGPKGDQGPAGSSGPKGDAGVQGPVGAAGPAGPKGDPGTNGSSFAWRGAFDCNASYSVGDAISYQGSAWITRTGIGGCVQPPFDPWELLAASGIDGAQGQQGPPGSQGPAGPQGPAGTAGPIAGYERVTNAVDAQPQSGGSVSVACPGFKRVVGGGWHIVSGFHHQVDGSYPSVTNSPYRWVVEFTNISSSPGTTRIEVVAICTT